MIVPPSIACLVNVVDHHHIPLPSPGLLPVRPFLRYPVNMFSSWGGTLVLEYSEGTFARRA